jgi:CRISPR/Cas system CMR-associated protein Cmr1 (group 7 of RAMP superfamily)
MNDDYVKVEGSPNLVKDKITGIVLNNDKSGLAAAKRRKQLAEEQKEEKQLIQKLKSDNDELKDEVAELKELVKSLIDSKV